MQQLSPQRLSAGLLADFEDERELEIGRPANATEGKRVEGGDESTGKRESVMKREELQWNIATLRYSCKSEHCAFPSITSLSCNFEHLLSSRHPPTSSDMMVVKMTAVNLF